MNLRLLLGLLAAIVSVLVWGVTFVNTKALLVQFSSLEIHFLRFLVAYLVLGLIHPHRPHVPRRDEGLFAAFGLFGVAIYQLMENCAIHYTNASNVAILVSLCPVMTALLVRFWGGGAPLKRRFFIGCGVAMTGVVLVSLNGIRVLHFRPLGDGLAVLSMLSWSVYSLLMQRAFDKGYSQLFIVRRTFFWALIWSLPVVLFGLTDAAANVLSGSFCVTCSAAANVARWTNPLNYLNLGFLALLASAGCFVFWNIACRTLGVVRCTVGLYLIPAVTVVVAYLFLGEQLTFVSGCGAVLILLGVGLSTMAQKETNS